MSLLFLLACTGSSGPSPVDTADTSDTSDPTDTADTADIAVTPTFVLCGGGTEGEIGETSWSDVYGRGLDAGDVTGDGRVRVAVLSAESETDWVPDYLVSLGADEAENVRIGTRGRASEEEVIEALSNIDAVFLKGGDQGVYYDSWNDTPVEDALRVLVERGGGVIGTSAGAMSQSQYALAGGADYVTADVLADSHTEYLDDTDGGSGIHSDFLGFLPDTLVDTHFVTRARLGRLAGALARVVEDEGTRPLGIGLDEQTCITVRDGVAEVSGVGSVTFLQPGAEAPVRVPGEPLIWADLPLDRLVEGWSYDLIRRAPLAPADAEPVAWSGTSALPDGDWSISGDTTVDEERFATVVARSPDAYAVREGTEPPLLPDAVGVLNAHASERRGANDEAMFRALYDRVGSVGYLVGEGGALAVADNVVSAEGEGRARLATMILDTSGVTSRMLAPSPSAADVGDGSLHAAALTGVHLHVLYSPGDGRGFDPVRRTVE